MSRTPLTPASSQVSGGAHFAATRWTLVLAAGENGDRSRARQALSELARAYWFPLYAYARKKGKTTAEAEDLTQAFFTRLIEKNTLGAANPERGKFRSFLLTSFNHFMISEYQKDTAQKRGGGQVGHLDIATAETRYSHEPATDLSPEKVYEQRWAWAVLDRVLASLREQYKNRGQEALFDALKGALTAQQATRGHADFARKLGLTDEALRVAVHRLRKRYRDALREEIAQTLADPSLVDEEIRYLLACL